jgi:hypothetical protein
MMLSYEAILTFYALGLLLLLLALLTSLLPRV